MRPDELALQIVGVVVTVDQTQVETTCRQRLQQLELMGAGGSVTMPPDFLIGDDRTLPRYQNPEGRWTDQRIAATSNVCAHQNGPLGEGRVIDGCITCPWHGWQYKPDTGTSPPPFHEVIETYPVRIENGAVYVKPSPNPLESKCEGASISENPS